MPILHSEELALLAGDLKPVDLGAGHNEARDLVVRKGKADGREHAVAVFMDGRSVEFGGSHSDRLKVPEFENASGIVVVHHNHPLGDSLSRQDLLLLLTRADISRIDAHGHRGGWFSAERSGKARTLLEARAAVDDAFAQIRTAIVKAVKQGEVDEARTRAGLWQVAMALLMTKQGQIQYSANTDSVLDMAKRVLRWRIDR